MRIFLWVSIFLWKRGAWNGVSIKTLWLRAKDSKDWPIGESDRKEIKAYTKQSEMILIKRNLMPTSYWRNKLSSEEMPLHCRYFVMDHMFSKMLNKINL